MILWEAAMAENPMIAILRGVEPANAIAVADVLVAAGFRIIEVPLNSPDPFESIAAIASKYGDRIIVGAGTVLTTEEVEAVFAVGGRIIVSPNMNPVVGREVIARGGYWCPGVLTPTEAFAALEIGASALKFFPAELVPPKAIAAMRAVLPKETTVAAVGGITPETMAEYYKAGSNGFGLGSALFKPSYSLQELQERATMFVSAYQRMSAP